MSRMRWAVAAWLIGSTTTEAGLFHHREARPVPAASPNLVAPNGVVVPAWASQRMRQSPVPLYGPGWGRRPWAFPLAQQATPSAYWARLDQLGYGAGPIPGYTNGPGLGNIPSAPIGPDGGPAARRGFAPPLFFPNSPFFPGN